jgi:transcriptional regulator with XRE-family HTH domain
MPKGSIRINSGRLRELRTAAALSHQALAAMTGLTRQTTTRIEAIGVAMPKTVQKLAEALNVDPSELL